LHEELSLKIEQIEKVETHRAFYEDGGMFEVDYCFVSNVQGEPMNNVFEQIRWVTVEELRSLDVLEGNRPFIESLTGSRSSR